MRTLPLAVLALVSPLAVAASCGSPPEPQTAGKGDGASSTVVSVSSPTIATSTAPSASTTASAVAKTPELLLEVDEKALDRSVDACDDFYQFACGGWMKATPIPEDRPAWARGFSVVDERNEEDLRKTLEADAAGAKGDAYAQKLGDFWTACMDEPGIEQAGLKPLDGAFAAIDKLGKDEKQKVAAGVSSVVRELYAMGFGPLFNFSSGQDFGDATQVIGQLEQGGLGLPERDYYLEKDKKSVEIRALYEEHVGKMLELAGFPAAGAKTVMAIETELAKSSMKKEDRREPKKVYHRMKLAELKKLAPSFEWDGFFDALSLSHDAPINVAQPDFVKSFETRFAQVKADDWKVYFRWHVLKEAAKSLPKKFVDEDFHFKSTALTGAKQLLPRWKRCIATATDALGEALAQPFVRDHFGAEGKERSKSMVAQIEEAMKRDLEALPWMDEPTRKKALEKLAKINNKIGFPDVWRNYDSLEVTRDSYATNLLHASVFEQKRQLAKIGKPLDRNEWLMSPPEVNAYYDASMNEMVFPAGILQSPFFGVKAPLAMNFGAIGMVMGHELTHGFDDEGRQFDGDGNLKEWWSPKVGKDFDKRAGCIIKQFSGYVGIDDLKVNGKLTQGENIADLGGLKLSYAAFVEARKGKPEEPKQGAFTADQQFFLAYAQSWCMNARDPYRRLLVNTDPHSPPHWRVDGPLSNVSSFANAFSCKDGSKMVRPAKDRCEIW